MHSRDANDPLNVQRASHLARPAEHDKTEQVGESLSYCEYSRQDNQPNRLLVTPPSRMYPAISTESIMRAVEQQRRITQELDDLCARQKQSAVHLRSTCLKLMVGVGFSFEILGFLFVFLLIFQPDILVQLLAGLNGPVAMLVGLEEGIGATLSLIPSNGWLLSGLALAIVLMTGMWLRLMRYPQEV
jgi:hypothetical protein